MRISLSSDRLFFSSSVGGCFSYKGCVCICVYFWGLWKEIAERGVGARLGVACLSWVCCFLGDGSM